MGPYRNIGIVGKILTFEENSGEKSTAAGKKFHV
jgi:hypothetical protein